MQHDPGFARALLAGEPDAVASSGLGPRERALLGAADPRAVSADRAGRRRAQLQRNLAGELPLAAAVGPGGDGDTTWVAAFQRSAAFHDAVARDRRLPLAFAEHAEAVAAAGAVPAFRALVALEAALLRLRRESTPGPAPEPLAPDAVRLAPGARLQPLPAGAFALASALRARIDAGASGLPLPPHRLEGGPDETVLLWRLPAASPDRLPEVRAEPLAPAIAALLRRAARPLTAAERRDFAREHDVEPEDVELVVADYAAEGVLRAGTDLRRPPLPEPGRR